VIPEEYLPTIAEVGITIAGFTGLIVTVRRNPSVPWSKQEQFRIIATIAICLTTVLCSSLPFALSGLPVEPQTKWSVPLLISSTTILALLGLMLRRILFGGFVIIAPWITWPLMLFMGVLALASFTSGLGLILPYSPGLLVLQLSVSLFASAVTLIATLAIVVRNENEAK
jgi:hypothetical protein